MSYENLHDPPLLSYGKSCHLQALLRSDGNSLIDIDLHNKDLCRSILASSESFLPPLPAGNMGASGP